MTTSYVKEVESLIDEGLSEPAAVQTFQALVKRFEYAVGSPEVEDFRDEMLKTRKDDRSYYRSIIDGGCAWVPYPIEMTWRNVKFEPKRVKRCAVCSDYFYDVSRNGGSIACFNGWCGHEYEVRRKRPGTILAPSYRRRVNELLIDVNPSESDKQGHAILNEFEKTAWRQRVGY